MENSTDITEYHNLDDNLSLRSQSAICEHLVAPVNQTSRKPAERWKLALRKMKSLNLDAWYDFPLDDCVTKIGTRHRYSAIKKKWVVDEVKVKLERNPFDRGSMRECFRMKKFSHIALRENDWEHSSNYVAKRYLSAVDKQIYFDDVKLQMEAKLWGEAFNRQDPPKKVDIFQLAVLELRAQSETLDQDNMCTESVFYHIERYMEGDYRKYNSNSGFVDDNSRNTPQAFSHFTFERSGHRLLVVDIQGVGDLYTDPQIHSYDGIGYNDGNLGLRGMALFFHSHICNPLCEWLSLAPFDLAPSEIKARETDNLQEVSAQKKHLDSGSKRNFASRRRSVSFNHHLYDKSSQFSFGPTVVRATDNMRSRLRYLSSSICDHTNTDWSYPTNLSADTSLQLAPEDRRPNVIQDFKFVPLKAYDKHNNYPCPLYTTDFTISQQNVQIRRDRAESGDSGYSGDINMAALSLPTNISANVAYSNRTPFSVVPLQQTCSSKISDSLDSFANLTSPLSSSFVTPLCPNHFDSIINDISPTSSLQSVFADDRSNPIKNMVYSFRHHFGINHPNLGRVFSRRRNISESSDLDAEEHYHMGGNLCHQLMHESHRPSCANHPTNMDQEIGHSILGQIHHELARLHEAGRFIPSCEGGWSFAGLGGLILKHKVSSNRSSGKDAADDDDQVEASVRDIPTVDWSAVLFHEHHAAQLGCLEAIVVMAQYYLSLPTALLSDCPIKPTRSDIRSGIDYLWRASEGGDRRSMILLARYLDISVSSLTVESVNDPFVLPNDLLILPTLQTLINDDPSVLPPIAPDGWIEAVSWYRRAVDSVAKCTASVKGQSDDYHDAEGNYDSAEDLLPIYRILGRMAEMYYVGGFGLKQDYSQAGDLFNEAGESASSSHQGCLAVKYFELSEKAYAALE